MNQNDHQICLGVIGSTTYATRAQRALTRAAIRAEVVNISAGQKSGCVYGVKLPCSQRQIAEDVLAREHIPIRSWSTSPLRISP
jgi:hypothetical protein